MADVVLLNDLPVVIDGPGEYFTRRGRRALVRKVKQVAPGSTMFAAEGAFYSMFRGQMVARGHVIWHVSGRFNAVGAHANDLVRKA